MAIEFTIEDAVKRILKEPAPILFPDTCSLVDIIRLPMRVKDGKTLEIILKSAVQILSATRLSRRKVWIVIAPPISTEWIEHSVNTKDELKRHLINLDSDLAKIHSVATNRGILLKSQNDYENSKINDVLYDLSSELFNHSLFLAEDKDCIVKSYTRAIGKVAPAKTGDNHKDCLIIEHILLLCDELNKKGFSENLVFLTANKNDFCEPNKTPFPKPPLDVEFASANLQLALSWNWAQKLLGI